MGYLIWIDREIAIRNNWELIMRMNRPANFKENNEQKRGREVQQAPVVSDGVSGAVELSADVPEQLLP